MSTAIRIVIAALGGEGGGVLGKWIADMAGREGYLSQTTSVPGVAQRTGATIYYIELFPRAEAEKRSMGPVMSMFPTPGDVDIVICSEIVEAGRMIQRGFVTPGRTTLISSTHRTFGIAEKEALGNGVVDKSAIEAIARESAKTYIGFDMLETARQFDSVINAALFGALAETAVLPFGRDSFEETIRLGKIAVDSNLQTFAASYELARQQHSGGVQYVQPIPEPTGFEMPAATTAAGAELVTRIAGLPLAAREMAYLGVKKLVHYQDHAYAGLYLDRLDSLCALEQSEDALLLVETARFLALWMAFEDLPRVAQIKISAQRFERFREEVKAQPEQHVGMVEFLHPRVEEFCAVMPARIGRYVQDSAVLSRMLGWFARPRTIRTDSIHGYLLFYLMAGMRRYRTSSLIYQIEQAHIEQWLAAVTEGARKDYATGLELSRCGRLIKGYGATRERGTANLQKILGLYRTLTQLSASSVQGLREAALADDQGLALDGAARNLSA